MGKIKMLDDDCLSKKCRVMDFFIMGLVVGGGFVGIVWIVMNFYEVMM